MLYNFAILHFSHLVTIPSLIKYFPTHCTKQLSMNTMLMRVFIAAIKINSGIFFHHSVLYIMLLEMNVGMHITGKMLIFFQFVKQNISFPCRFILEENYKACEVNQPDEASVSVEVISKILRKIQL